MTSYGWLCQFILYSDLLQHNAYFVGPIVHSINMFLLFYYCQFTLHCYTAFIFVSFFAVSAMHEFVNGEMPCSLVITRINIILS